MRKLRPETLLRRFKKRQRRNAVTFRRTALSKLRFELNDRQFAHLCDGDTVHLPGEIEIALEDIGFQLMLEIVKAAARRRGVNL